MDIKDLLQAAIDKDAGSFETAFDSIMAAKSSAAIEAKYDSMYAESGDTEEAVEVDTTEEEQE